MAEESTKINKKKTGKRTVIPTKQLATMAVFGALAIVFALYIRFPMPFAPFLEYDAGDIPLLIVSFMFGPLSGVILTVIVSVIQGVSVSAASGWWGVLMHIISSSVFVAVAGLIYKRKKTYKGAIAGLFAGYLAVVVVMIPANIIITPIYTGMPREALIKSMLGFIVAFNAVKGIINLVVTLVIYKSIHRLVNAVSNTISEKISERKQKNRLKKSGSDAKDESGASFSAAANVSGGNGFGSASHGPLEGSSAGIREIDYVRYTHSAEETFDIGKKLAAELSDGDTVLLSGELGAGKTTFTKGLASGLGIADEITSPTFTFLNIYTSGRMPLKHFDMYRIESEDEISELGLQETAEDGKGVSVIEWNKLENLSGRIIEVSIDYSAETSRKISIKG